MAIIALRLGSALMSGGTIIRIVRSLLPTVVTRKYPKKDSELTTLVLVIYTDMISLVVVFITVAAVVVSV